MERADKAAIRKLIVEIKDEKREWLNNSIERMYDAGMTVFEMTCVLNVSAETIFLILRYHFLVEREDIR